MTKLIFKSGLRTIGGTIVEVIDGNDRIIFDFGTVFAQKEEMPQVDGVYDNSCDYNDIVLISHLHLDHSKAMNLIDPSIDIVMNEKSVEFIEDLYNIGFNGFLGEKRSYRKIRNRETIIHGKFKITNILVDHDVEGASAFVIETNDLKLFYSGDIRLHGLQSQYTYQMIDYIKAMDIPIDVAIFEGVTISFIDDEYHIVATDKVEADNLEINFSNSVTEMVKEDLILVNPYIMGIERLQSIIDLALKQNKVLCVTDDFGYLLSKHFSDVDFVVLAEDRYNLNKKVIGYDDITPDFIVFFKYASKELFKDFSSSVALLQTGGEPLGEYDERWRELEEWCDTKGVNLYKIGVSGHAYPENLIYIIDQVNATYLMPLHSFKPELVKSDNSIQILPEKDKEYIFINHKLQ